MVLFTISIVLLIVIICMLVNRQRCETYRKYGEYEKKECRKALEEAATHPERHIRCASCR